MRKAWTIVLGVNAGVILLLPVLLGSRPGSEDYLITALIVALIAAPADLVIGIILVAATRRGTEAHAGGLACLITAGVLLLAGFTMCSGMS